MRKISKIIISIVIVLGVMLFGIYYALIPSERIDIVEGRLITSEELLTGSFINGAEVLKNPLRLQGKISMSGEEFKNVVYTVMTEYNIKDFKNVYIDVKNNAIKVISPYKILGFIDSQVETDINPSVVDNNLNIKLTHFKLGKIKINDKTVSKGLRAYQKEIPFVVQDNSIIVDKKYTYPMTLNDVNIKEKKIILDLQLQVNNLIDFISKYKVNAKQQ